MDSLADSLSRFEEIVATLGDIVIDVTRPVKDNAYPTADFGVERV